MFPKSQSLLEPLCIFEIVRSPNRLGYSTHTMLRCFIKLKSRVRLDIIICLSLMHLLCRTMYSGLEQLVWFPTVFTVLVFCRHIVNQSRKLLYQRFFIENTQFVLLLLGTLKKTHVGVVSAFQEDFLVFVLLVVVVANYMYIVFRKSCLWQNWTKTKQQDSRYIHNVWKNF